MAVRAGKIICSGLNYRDTVLEDGAKFPEKPLLFLKPDTAIIGDGEAIVKPEEVKILTIEAELAVVIGKKGKNIPREKAWDYIRGCRAANDVTAKDAQKEDIQWTRAKSYDTFLPLSPEVPVKGPLEDVEVCSYINGKLAQKGNIRDMIFDIPYLVSYISGIMTLEPGDIILTGTPGGYGKEVRPGDEVRIEISRVGRITNEVIT